MDTLKEVHELRMQQLRVYAQQKRASARGFDSRTDLYQGEYVAPCDERLAWLTGFPGSAGYALILEDKAALFVDGRYTLQAAQQVPPSVEVHHYADSPASAWLAQNLKPGSKILYDPWLHTPNDVDGWKKTCKHLQLTFEEAPENPIDVLWQDRLPRPLGLVDLHDNQYAGFDRSQKLADLETLLIAEEADACVISSPDLSAGF